MGKNRGSICGVSMILTLFSMLLLFGISSANAEEKWVSYLSNADYTGPIASLVLPMDQGEEDYFRYVNEQGGINGVKIKWIGVDTRYDVSRMISTYKRYSRDPKLVATTTWSTTVTKILAPYVKKNRLMQITPADGEFQAHIGRTFLICPPYQDGYAAMIDWIIKDWKSTGKKGMPVVGEMAWDIPYGKERLRGGREYAEKMGVKLLKPEYFPMGTMKYVAYLKRLANAGANYIGLANVEPKPNQCSQRCLPSRVDQKNQIHQRLLGSQHRQC